MPNLATLEDKSTFAQSIYKGFGSRSQDSLTSSRVRAMVNTITKALLEKELFGIGTKNDYGNAKL